MNLLDQPQKQIEDCIDWMRKVAALKNPGPAQQAEISEGLTEHALFLEKFVMPKIAPVARHLFEGKEKSFVDDLINTSSPTIDPEPIPFLQRNGEQPAPAPRS